MIIHLANLIEQFWPSVSSTVEENSPTDSAIPGSNPSEYHQDEMAGEKVKKESIYKQLAGG